MKTKTDNADRENFGQLIRQLKAPVNSAHCTDITEAPSKPDRVPSGKRSAQFQRKYARAIATIESGMVKPEVKPVSSHVSCSTRTASSILTKAVQDDERFERDSRGRVTFKFVA